jgi:NADH:ubiquinone oxidoreductase subunit F (NADH-binding)
VTEVLAPPAGVARLLAQPADPGRRAHLAQFGPLPAGVDAIAAAERAGLRGRGGAAFPASLKLAAVARRRGAVVVANGTEGEPLSAKDKTLLVSAPHLVLDGVVLAAAAVGAREAVVCVERAATRVVAAVEHAVGEREGPVAITVAEAPSRYVAGEETALVRWLNGGDAKPTTVPPRPFERGVNGRPTLVHNVETLAHLALIARFGPSWFRSLGTAADPGTALVTVGGGVAWPGVYEVEQGSGLAATLGAAGLGDGPLPPVLVGGYFGAWLAPEAVASAALGPSALRAVGASFGTGVLWALPADVCGLAETARVARWFADQSAGQCGPCTNGLPALAGAMDAVVAGRAAHSAVEHLRRYASLVTGRGACHHPDGAAQLVTSAVDVFADEVERHARLGPCPATRNRALPVPSGGSWR